MQKTQEGKSTRGTTCRVSDSCIRKLAIPRVFAVILSAMVILTVHAPISYASDGLHPQPAEKQWFVSVEGGLGIGNLDRTLPGMELSVFNVDTLRSGGEHDGAGIRAGIGRLITRDMSASVYGGTSILFPGVFFDNHGPLIPPELLYTIDEKSLGLEVCYGPARFGAGYSFYSGTASLHPDKREGAPPGETWEGKLGNTGGPHLMLGFSGMGEGIFGYGIDLFWRNIPIQFLETPTGVIPERITRSMFELRLSLKVSALVL